MPSSSPFSLRPGRVRAAVGRLGAPGNGTGPRRVLPVPRGERPVTASRRWRETGPQHRVVDLGLRKSPEQEASNSASWLPAARGRTLVDGVGLTPPQRK